MNTIRASRGLRSRAWFLLGLGAAAACGGEHGGGLGGGGDNGAPDNGDGSAAFNGSSSGQSSGGPMSFGSGSSSGDSGGGTGTGVANVPGPVTPSSIDECSGTNPAGINASQVTSLMNASGSGGSMKWMYPYDQTIFPGGMLAPLLMWNGSTASAVYLHIVSKSFEYKGCLKPTGTGQVQLSQTVWDAASQHTGGSADPFMLTLTAFQTTGGLLPTTSIVGPITEHFVIAPATVKGSIYYNSYDSALSGATMASASVAAMYGPAPPAGTTGATMNYGGNGMILRIPPKKSVEVFASATCEGCHSVSASGNRLLASSTMGALSYALTPTTAPNPPSMAAGPTGCFGALYPDGSIYVTSALPSSFDLAHCGSNKPSALLTTDTGAAVTGSNVPTTAMMPTFSPDGQFLVWTDAMSATSILTASFSRATNATSAQRTLYSESSSTLRPGWPFMLPDDKGVIFDRTDSSDFTGTATSYAPNGPMGPAGDLSIVDVQSGTMTILARAMGFATPAAAASGKSYLGGDEIHMNYYPTVSPVAAGGYFWVFFDSIRHYGNKGLVRQLWGTAVLVSADGSYKSDPSAPAFYVTGQEFGAGNHRAFTALDPCLAQGASCTSGVDCCDGFCSASNGNIGICGKPETPQCSMIDEACKTTADCCTGGGAECIAGYCATVQPTPK